MIDRHGSTIFVGWAEHELLWLRAALTMPCGPRNQAYRDIADLTGRRLQAVRDKAYWLKGKVVPVTIMQPRMALPRPSLPPSQLRPPTRAQLMGGRATGRRPFLEAAE